MRLLVTGAAGMLGRSLVVEGRRRGDAVLGLGRDRADLLDREALTYWVREFRPEAVINAAAMTAVDACEDQRERAFAVNGEGVGNVLAAAREVGARLVHVSTDYVFPGDDDHHGRPYPEDDPTGPKSVYGQSKLEGERRALEDDTSTVVRTSWLFGPGGGNFVATMVRLIDQGKTPLRVVDDQVGRPTYVPFLARALRDLAAVPSAMARAAGVVHYANRGTVSWHGFAEEIARQYAPGTEVLPVTTEEFPRPAPRPAWSVLATERFEGLVGRPVEPWIWGLSNDLAARRAERRGPRGELKR